MCGFSGFLGYQGMEASAVEHIALRMGRAILHRGPDGSGIWLEHSAELAFVHRRLAIIDLSPAGHQPMASGSGRYTIVFNGEIYNHVNLRSELEAETGPQCWRGHSDTETLLGCFDHWGIEKTLEKSVGMFAIAMWDKVGDCLVLARDRIGEKPLYYGVQQGVFMFASELKSLKCHPAFIGKMNRNAIALQLRHNYIPAPYSIYEGIGKLPPGTILRIPSSGGNYQLTTSPVPYWSLPAVVEHSKKHGFQGSATEAIDALDGLLRNSVKLQSMADVPLGAFLSGGIDSSLIASLLQSQSGAPVNTFTIGFNEAGYDEAVHAKAIARHLGTRHTELYVSAQQALDVIPGLATIYDEPFSDSSQIPTFLVAQMTRKAVTVSLSGDGGDELFGGYTRYFGTARWWDRIQTIPVWMRHRMSQALSLAGPEAWNRLGGAAALVTGRKERWQDIGNGVTKLAGVLSVDNSSELYRHFVTHWTEPAQVVIGGVEPPTQVSHPGMHLPSIVEQMMALDTLSYLPDDILVKVDRAAMASSLETRVPFLDHRVLEFAWTLPLHLKIRDGQGKWILRQVLNKYVPASLLDRPKMGFRIPLDSWLRGPLREWAESLLDETRLRNEGIFEPTIIRKRWEEHLSGKRNWQYHLWDILMFQAWAESA